MLQNQGIIDGGDPPPLPQSPPRYDDEGPLGVNFFRTRLADAKLNHLSLPRTFFGRSEIFDVSFGDSDLSESTANWNDFIRVDFTAADLDGAKMTRATAAGVHLSQKQQRMIDLKDADGDEPGGGQSGYASTRFQLPCFVAPAQPDDRQAAGRPRPAGQANLERQQDPGGARRSSSHLHRLKQRVCRHVMPLQTRTYRVWISPGYSLVSQPCALALEQHTQNPRQRMLQNQM